MRDSVLPILDTAAEFWASARVMFENDGVASRLHTHLQEALALR